MLLERLIHRRDGAVLSTLADPARWLFQALTGGQPTDAGVDVTVASAEGLPTIYRCREILAAYVAQAPLKLYRRIGEDGDKELARDERLYGILHDQPNPEMTSADFWAQQMLSLTGWGNAYAEIQRDSANNVLNLWPLSPERMTVDRDPALRLRYRYRMVDGSYKTWGWNWRTPSVWHLRINALDGINGRSPITIARESIGGALASERYGAKFWANDGGTPGALVVPGPLTKAQEEQLRDAYTRMHTGTNARKFAILSNGADWKSFAMPNDDAQFLETRRFNSAELCKLYGVPPHMVGDTDRSTSWGTGIEQQEIGFVARTMGRYYTLIQQAVPMFLLNTQTASEFFARFELGALMAGDAASRWAAYREGRNLGVLNADEIRRKEDMNAIGGRAGSVYWMPANTLDASETPDTGGANGTGTPNING